jgi:4-hydroxybenzoate adenylyltransferase
LDTELSGGNRRTASPLPGNFGANGLAPLEEGLKKVEELLVAIGDSDRQRVADRLRALLGTVTDGEERLGKRIQDASTPDEIFQLIDSEFGE